jgi:hypothetical protein
MGARLPEWAGSGRGRIAHEYRLRKRDSSTRGSVERAKGKEERGKGKGTRGKRWN